MTDDFWKDRFHYCALAAGIVAKTEGRLDDSEYVRQLAYRLYEEGAFKEAAQAHKNPNRFIRTVLLLWGDHWQKPCLAFLAKHGHHYTRQTLWNWKTGKRRVPEHVEELLENERKAKTTR